MRVPLSLLSEYVAPSGEYADTAQPDGWNVECLADRLVMTGTEIEAIHQTGPPSMEGYVVGQVLEVTPHPDADRLRVCRVDTGDDEVRTIVCGAPNVAAGQTVPVVLPGAVMPGGMKIKRSKLRGVVSEGMICSESELEISAESDGIMVLAEGVGEAGAGADFDGLAPGRPLAEILPVVDTVLELEVTPNRSDCFGIYGFAREVHAVTGGELTAAPWESDVDAEGETAANQLASVTVEAPDLCPRFTARVFTEVEVGPSPRWLKQALTGMGQRSINNVVDVTNYVMLITGQPLHAFDLDLVAGEALTIRAAREGERVETLDGVERVLDSEMVLVCDADGPAAIAGVMGGARSEVRPETTRVLLEVANWNGPNILATSRRLALRSEASSRFERQLHPVLCDWAQALASKLLVELCGAVMAPGTIDVSAGMPEPREIPFAFGDAERLLGVEVSRDEAEGHLGRLGFGVGSASDDRAGSAGTDPGEPWAGDPEAVVVVPPDRHYDVTRPADLIEEIGRLHGYENLPSALPALAAPGGLSQEQIVWRITQDALRYQGFDEVVGWSFTDPGEAGRLRLSRNGGPVRLSNPLSEDQSVMRETLLGSLMTAAAYNAARGAERVALFESGRVYLQGETVGDGEGGPLAGSFPGQRPAAVSEPQRLAALTIGPVRPGAWDGTPAAGGFYALKGVLEALAGRLGLRFEFAAPVNRGVEAGEHGFLHPGRAAVVSLIAGGRNSPPLRGETSLTGVAEGDQRVEIGWLGELHPAVAAEWDLAEVTAFELDLAPLVAAATVGEEIYADVTSFPSVRQDLAVVVPETTSAGEVQATVREAGGELLRQAEVFDLFRGEQIGEGKESLALRLEFQAADRTLTEEEVGGLRERIESAIEGIGGSIRE